MVKLISCGFLSNHHWHNLKSRDGHQSKDRKLYFATITPSHNMVYY